MPPALNRENIAGVAYAECGGFRAGGSFSREASIRQGVYQPRREEEYRDGQWQQRLAVAIVVVNLSRQRLPWGDGSRTMPPLRPRGTDEETRASWEECLAAADEALRRSTLGLTDPRVMEGAQFYTHVPPSGKMQSRFEGAAVLYHIYGPAWDANHRRDVWLHVHIDRALRDRRSAAPASP